ncbi:MAG: hypothetical protein ACMVY4_11350 [Minwuia sp.]|uniref:hypothetical protein n=1 Tax=Minwuia sp. TaxID=2493630 RepID=UPI003A86E874
MVELFGEDLYLLVSAAIGLLLAVAFWLMIPRRAEVEESHDPHAPEAQFRGIVENFNKMDQSASPGSLHGAPSCRPPKR